MMNKRKAIGESKRNARHQQLSDQKTASVFPGTRLIGIGTAADGLEALRELIESLPDSSQLAYVIVQHASSQQVGMLSNFLTPLTQLKIQELSDSQKPEPKTIYITPQDSEVIYQDGLLQVTEPAHSNGPHSAINTFFISLANALGEQAIGIILSGTGVDGVEGMRAIKTAGGITIVQKPDTAKYNALPKAVIRDRCIDLILRPVEIGSTLKRIVMQPYEACESGELFQKPSPEIGSYDQINDLIRINTGFRLNDYKSNTVQRRIQRRMNMLGITSLTQYIEYIQIHKEEALLLVRETFISVTGFFRDTAAFEALRTLIENLVKNQPKCKIIRCWVSGCATGEEAYSLAMLLEEALNEQSRYDLQYLIFASDLDDVALDQARSAQYPLNEIDSIPPGMRERYTEKTNDHFCITKRIRNQVVFARHNVIEDPPFAHLDLITCRNLLIYLKQLVQQRILEIFHYALNPGGYLFLGKSENIDAHKSLFKTVDGFAHIYQRLNGLTHYALSSSQRDAFKAKTDLFDTRIDPKMDSHSVSTRMLEKLAEHYAPPTLVIDNNANIVHFHGNLKNFLDFPKGRADMHLFSLVDRALVNELRTLIYRCRRDRKTVYCKGCSINIDDQKHTVTIMVTSMEDTEQDLLLISFRAFPLEEYLEADDNPGNTTQDQRTIAQLDQELLYTRNNLDAVFEELETSNEALLSSNDELQSLNEALQSTNEELQNSNEELQSANEELLTVNEEMQIKSTELEQIARDLTNVKESLAFPLIVVSTHLFIMQANAACRQIAAIESTLQNISLNNVQWLIEVAGLIPRIRNVMNTGDRFQETLISHQDTAYLLHVMPYLCPQLNKVDGAVLLFEDITARHHAEMALKKSNERFNWAVMGSTDGLWIRDTVSGDSYWSPRYKNILGYREDEIEVDNDYWKSRLHPEDRDATLAAMESCLNVGTLYDVEYRLKHKSGRYIWIQARGRRIQSETGARVHVAGSITDITQRKRTELNLVASERKFNLAMQHAPIGKALISEDNSFIEVNPVLCQIIGYTAKELLQCNLTSITHPDDLDNDRELARKMNVGAIESYQTEKRYIHKKGHTIWAQLNVAQVSNTDETPLYKIVQIQDITERRQAEDELRLAASVFSSTLDGIMITAPDGTVLKVNNAFERITGYNKNEIIGKNTRLLRSDRHDEEFYDTMWQSIERQGNWQGEIWDRHKKGHVIPIWLSISTLYNKRNQVKHHIAIMYDISEQKISQDRINYLAHYDVLTGLPNRTLFMERLTHAVNQAQRQDNTLTVMFIDLDNFKHINDSYGHQVGDELLCLVAKRLQDITRACDTVARLSGDEFTLLIDTDTNSLNAQNAAQKILNALEKPFKLEDNQMFVSASIGIVLFPDDGNDVDTLLKHADLAMYQSKEAGRNQFQFYTQEMSSKAKARMDLHEDLRKALDQNELLLHFQPIVSTHTRRCIGVEALVRWRHPVKGWIPPSNFIAIAEEYNLIHPLGEWVFQAACSQMKSWLDMGIELDFISVNVSGKQLIKKDFVSLTQRILKDSDCPPERVVIELTESYLMRENNDAIVLLNDLRNLGCGIAIDDFGTGYSSLAYLKRLPVTKLKLDQSFVSDIPNDSNDVAIARAILKLGETLGLEVVAEGVETQEQHNFLLAEGCLFSQGYLYSKPVAADVFLAILNVTPGTAAAKS